MAPDISAISIIDSTLIIALFSGFFYFIGSIFDPKVNYNRYASGFITSVTFIIAPVFVFFFYHYQLNRFVSDPKYGIIFSGQIIFAGILIFISSKPTWISKLKNLKDKHPMFHWLILAAFSWIMIGLGLENSINYNPYSSFIPENNFQYIVRAFFVYFPVIISLAEICLLLVLASGKTVYPQSKQNLHSESEDEP